MGDAELVRTASAGISGQENLETVIELFRDRALVASESGDHLIALEMHDVADAAERLHWGISIAENY